MMNKSLMGTILLIAALFLPMQSQNAEFLLQSFGHKTYKLVLLGDRESESIAEWKQIINSSGIYEYDFILLDRAGLASILGDSHIFEAEKRGIEYFERWFVQRYGINSLGWAALDHENKLIVSGTQTPTAKAFAKLLEQSGIKSPLNLLRAFLRENPEHLDAKTDLLKEIRRRALQQMPTDINEELDKENDLRIWGVLAAETNNVFSDSWLGIDLRFFKPNQGTPERFSKLMRNVFRKHIISVESAIREQPTNRILWNIWAWMARSLSYNWDTFVDSLDSLGLYTYDSTCPSPEVCVWLIEDSRTKKDWERVIKFAKIAGKFDGYYLYEEFGWEPGFGGVSYKFYGFEGYPEKSIFAPHLEALLRLGKIEDANNVFDEMIRFYDKAENALMASEIARAVDMEDVAEVWKQGQVINKTPYFRGFNNNSNNTVFILFVDDIDDNKGSKDYFTEFIDNLSSNLSLYPIIFSAWGFEAEMLGWRGEDGYGWGLLASDGRLLYKDTSMDVELMKSVLERFGVENPIKQLQNHLAKYGDQPGIILHYVMWLMRKNIDLVKNEQKNAPLDSKQDEIIWDETFRCLNKILTNYPYVLLDLPEFHIFSVSDADVFKQSSLIKSLSKPYLTVIESLLERKPSSYNLWSTWFFWRNIDDGERSLESLLEILKPSPFAERGITPLAFATDLYYKECKKNGDWPRLIKLLKNAWDRKIFIVNVYQEDEDSVQKGSNSDLGDMIGAPLIEAYLNDDKPHEANEIFNTWQKYGGRFTDFAKNN